MISYFYSWGHEKILKRRARFRNAAYILLIYAVFIVNVERSFNSQKSNTNSVALSYLQTASPSFHACCRAGQYSRLASIISSRIAFACSMVGTVRFRVNACNAFS